MKYLAPIFVWMVAILCTLGAAQEWGRSVDMAQRARVEAAQPRPVIKETKLEAADYQAIQARIPVFGSVRLVVTPQGLSVVASELSDYAAWRLTLDRVLLESAGVYWSVDFLCSGKCTDEEAHQAILSGVRRQISM